MKIFILLALLASEQPAEQSKQMPEQQAEQNRQTACSICCVKQTTTKLTPEAKTLCDGCFERFKFSAVPS